VTEQFKERYGFAQAAKATILVELGSAARAMATQRLAAAPSPGGGPAVVAG
jgi:hypothetical protein